MKVLFVCEGNAMRSQMAETFYNHMTKSHDATSAGAIASPDGTVSRRAVEVMKEIGLSMDGQRGTPLTEKLVTDADKIILFPTDFMPDYATDSLKATLWNVVDPHYHQEEGMELVRKVRDDIRERVKQLIKGKS